MHWEATADEKKPFNIMVTTVKHAISKQINKSWESCWFWNAEKTNKHAKSKYKAQNFRIIFFIKLNWCPVLSADKAYLKLNYSGKLGMALLSLLPGAEKSSWQLPAPGGTGVLLLVKLCVSYKRKKKYIALLLGVSTTNKPQTCFFPPPFRVISKDGVTGGAWWL